jgi:hypothetical protein
MTLLNLRKNTTKAWHTVNDNGITVCVERHMSDNMMHVMELETTLE